MHFFLIIFFLFRSNVRLFGVSTADVSLKYHQCVCVCVCVCVRTRNAVVRDECVCVCVCVCVYDMCVLYIYGLGMLSSYADVC